MLRRTEVLFCEQGVHGMLKFCRLTMWPPPPMN